jgi:hypothetical protein
MHTTKMKMRRAALCLSCLLAMPAAALEPIDEGEVTLAPGSLALQPQGCPPIDTPFDSTTTVSSGALTPDSIQKTFEDNLPALSHAYLRGLARNRCLSGSVRVHVDAAASGVVTNVHMQFSNPGLAVIREGLAQAVGRFRFEPVATPSRLSYTLNFYPK